MKYKIVRIVNNVPHSAGVLTEKGRILYVENEVFKTEKGSFNVNEYPTIYLQLHSPEREIFVSPSLDNYVDRIGEFVKEGDFVIRSVSWQLMAVSHEWAEYQHRNYLLSNG